MKRLLITAILILAASSLALSEKPNGQDVKPPAKPNFTGTWKLNIEKSNFGPSPAPQSMIDKIDHQEPVLRLTSTRVDQGAEDSASLSWTTDGKESSNTLRGGEVKSKLRWEGAVLFMESVMNVGGNALSLQDKWTLSQDGKTLTMVRHYSGPEGDVDFTYVLERQ
jgi:hypothetical protein